MAASATVSRKTRIAKPARKAAKQPRRQSHAGVKKLAARTPIMIPIKTGMMKKAKPADPANPLGISLASIPFGYGRDAVMNALVGMLILVAVVSAGIFYPQTKTTQQALTATAPGVMQKK